MKRMLFIFFCWPILATNSEAQKDSTRLFPTSMASLHYAGGTGFLTAGISKVSRRNKIELGILYGYLPKSMGGEVHSVTLKFCWNPFGKKHLRGFYVEPVLAGAFFTQSFGNNLDLVWGNRYPHLYYWWPRALRSHVFLASQCSWFFFDKKIDRLAVYLEANVNDLYFASYSLNQKALKPIDIIFLGVGVKLYFR